MKGMMKYMQFTRSRMVSGIMAVVAAGFLIYYLFAAGSYLSSKNETLFMDKTLQPAGLCYFRLEKNMTDVVYAATLPIANSSNCTAYYARLDYGKPVQHGSCPLRTFCEVLEASCNRNGTLQAMGCVWYEDWGCECRFSQ